MEDIYLYLIVSFICYILLKFLPILRSWEDSCKQLGVLDSSQYTSVQISENIYQIFILAQTCKIDVQKSALLLFKLLMVIFKALKSSDFFFLFYYCIYRSHLTSSCSYPSQQLQSVRVCLLAYLNLNASRQTQHQMKSLAKPPLTWLGMRPTGGARLPWEACITVIHILLSLWEPGQDTIWRPFYLCFMGHTTSLLFCSKKSFLLSARNKPKRLDESLEIGFGPAWLTDCQCQGRFTRFSSSCCTAAPKIAWQC